jgi:hypothetical protein
LIGVVGADFQRKKLKKMKNKAAQDLIALRWKNPKRRKEGLKQLQKARDARFDKKAAKVAK